MASSDVIVIGAGIVGAACAHRLSAEGLSVVVIDRGAPAGGTTAHGEGNILVSDKGPGPELELAQRSIVLWREFAESFAKSKDDCFPSIEYEAKGGVVVSTTDEGTAGLRSFAALQRDSGVDAEELGADRIRELEPWLSPDAQFAVHYPEDAQVQPVIAAEAMLASARRSGARVVVGEEVVSSVVDEYGRLRGVRTDRDEFRARTVVLAAGPRSGDVATLFGASLPVLPRRGMILVTARMPRRVLHKVYDADYVSAVSSDDAVLQTSTVVESTASGTVLIGSSRERVGYDDRLRTEVLSAIAAKATRLFPFLADTQVIRSYGGFRAYMPDHLPVIGPDPGIEGLWYAVGHEGAGVGLAPATAELLTDLITGDSPSVDPKSFDPRRPSLAPFVGGRSAS